MDNNACLAGEANEITLSGYTYPVKRPTPSEMLHVAERMREMASKRCADPVEYAASYASKLPAAVVSVLLNEALKVGLSGSRASNDAVLDEYVSLDGLRWRLWFHVLRHASIAQDQAQYYVTEDNRYEVAEKLDKALAFEAVDPKVPEPTTGTGG